MRSQSASRVTVAGIALLAAATSFSCVDEEIVFDRDLFDQPATEALGMLGYFDADEKLTTCGNCHVGQQNQWEETAHADAWNGLQSSGHASEVCEGCHTVNELGNTLEEPAGHSTVPDDPRYYDVQCESCHGPGLTHVQNPDASQPLAPISVGEDLTFGCGECHQDAHHPFVEEWEQSKHSAPFGEFFPGGINAGAAAALRPECQSCHEGKGALRAFGVDDNFLEKGDDDPLPHTCAVCHDPHSTTNRSQLRFPIEVADVEQHLCARCHDRRSEPDFESDHGLHPHAPETGLLQGDVGWFPPDIQVDRGEIIATHGSELNEGLCATCHVASLEVTDSETGEFLVNSTGHLFQPIPCLDDQGIPTVGDCELTLEARAFEGCTGGDCHSETGAFSALTTATTRLQNLAEELLGLLEQVDPNLDEPGGVIDPEDGIFRLAEGAFFNWALVEFGGQDRADPRLTYAGAAAHNPFLTEQLLLASIEAVEEEYDLQASPGLNRARVLARDGMIR